MKRIVNFLLATILAVTSFNAMAQKPPFLKDGFEKITVKGNTCTGFFKTTTWKCEEIALPIYLMRAATKDSVVLISHGAGGLDSRHKEYAKALVSMGVNAVVIGHFEARGLDSSVAENLDSSRKKGGDAVNMALDAMAVGTWFESQPEWSSSGFGFIGESMGGGAAINIARPGMRKASESLFNTAPPHWKAIASLYPSCTERNTKERFMPYAFLFLLGEDDDFTPAKDCERQARWMNDRDGFAQAVVLPGQVHDFDRETLWRKTRVDNGSKCANINNGEYFTLEINGNKYPANPEGYAQMRRDCINMTQPYAYVGNKGNSKTGYAEWMEFFKQNLLEKEGS